MLPEICYTCPSEKRAPATHHVRLRNGNHCPACEECVEYWLTGTEHDAVAGVHRVAECDGERYLSYYVDRSHR